MAIQLGHTQWCRGERRHQNDGESELDTPGPPIQIDGIRVAVLIDEHRERLIQSSPVHARSVKRLSGGAMRRLQVRVLNNNAAHKAALSKAKGAWHPGEHEVSLVASGRRLHLASLGSVELVRNPSGM